MLDPFYRSFIREAGSSIILGAAVVLAVIIGLSAFMERDVVLVADNSGTLTGETVTARAPVTEDTPGPIINDKDVPDREIAQTAPLSDRDR